MGIGYASRNRQERKGGVRWNRLSNRCQTIRSSPLLGFRQGVQRWLGEDRCGAPPLRIVPTHPASSRSGCCTRGCTRSCSSVSSIAEPAKTPTQCGGGGIRTHGELAPSVVFKMAVRRLRTSASQCSRTFSAFAVPTHPSSSRVVSTRWLYAWRTGREYVDERQAGTDEWTRPRVASRRRGGARACDPHLLVRLVVRLRFGST